MLKNGDPCGVLAGLADCWCLPQLPPKTHSEASCFVPRVLMHQIELESNHYPITLYPSKHLPRMTAVVIRGRLIPFKAVDVAFFDHKPKRRCALRYNPRVPPHPPDTADISALPPAPVVAVPIQIGRRCARPSLAICAKFAHTTS